MEPKAVLDYYLSNLPGTVLVESWGEKGVFYNPGGRLKRGVYVLTVKEKDGANDRGSNLDRAGVYRVNLGLRKTTFFRLFGDLPSRPSAGRTVEMSCNFAALNVLLPHPVYAWMGWACVLNPSEQTFEELKPLIGEAYQLAREKSLKRK